MVTGSLMACGTVETNESLTVKGDVTTMEDVKVGRNMIIGGNLSSSGNITVGQNLLLRGSVFAAGNIVAGGAVNTNNSAEVTVIGSIQDHQVSATDVSHTVPFDTPTAVSHTDSSAIVNPTLSTVPVGESHQVRQFSLAQYYTDAGYKKSTARINLTKTSSLQVLESTISTHRTVTMQGIQDYIATTLDALDPMKEFYDQNEIRGLKFSNYKGRQRVDAEMVNILVDGVEKYRPYGTRRRRKRRTKRRQQRQGQQQRQRRGGRRRRSRRHPHNEERSTIKS
ncbi:uncharacterized protein BX664DRAFT_158502 [Halteromyces radiatus]|uniref:uncharacterized protein n=1 Tax=Halteromyces radiatus TaxID=101107 RepID=UPI00221F205A|nr:uncharacterized protein BX664DRAFT_158502 [Halteromyces radiatus]KAI8086485.1 hypothetical protein BX664DRAFT_158502 [Halteromyces radiatus]